VILEQAPSVAVVILNWNGQKYLQQYLPSVVASTYTNLKIIVADNASADNSVAFVQQQFPQVQVLVAPENRGFAEGYNYFLKQITADYYVLLNSDILVEPGWIEPVIALLESNPAIAAAQPRIRSERQPEYFEYAGAAGGWMDMLGYPFSRGRVFDTVEKDEGQYNDAVPVFWASGAAFFVRAAVFHEMGGFDSYFFAHQEEIDLCWRMQRMGYRVYACPQSLVYHVGGGTLPAGSTQKVFLNFRNNLIMLAKNLPAHEALWKIPVRFALDAVSAWKELLQGNTGYWRAILRAHIAFLGWWLRGAGTYRAPYPQLQGYYKGSVVWQYFVRRRRFFSQIVR
jgi:GT2 family glycosyltransferase